MAEVRPFIRSDREQLTRLANAHIAAVVPGWSVPTAALLAQLERQPGEYVVDPWVSDRATLVGLDGERVVAAAHLLRYANDDRVGDGYRDAGEIAWMICWPSHARAGREVVASAIDQLAAWQVRAQYADGKLPTTVTYGVSDAWPHIAGLYTEAGFDAEGGQTEVLLAGRLDAIPEPGEPPMAGLTLERVVGSLGTAFHAVLEGRTVGVLEVDDDQTSGGNNLRLAGWADEANHWVSEELRGRGIGTWLYGNGAAWLRLGETRRLLVSLIEDDRLGAGLHYYGRYGLAPVNRTRRGWRRRPVGRAR